MPYTDCLQSAHGPSTYYTNPTTQVLPERLHDPHDDDDGEYEADEYEDEHLPSVSSLVLSRFR